MYGLYAIQLASGCPRGPKLESRRVNTLAAALGSRCGLHLARFRRHLLPSWPGLTSLRLYTQEHKLNARRLRAATAKQPQAKLQLAQILLSPKGFRDGSNM